MSTAPTYGEKVVGWTFNPSGRQDVQNIKRLAADAINSFHYAANTRVCNTLSLVSAIRCINIGVIKDSELHPLCESFKRDVLEVLDDIRKLAVELDANEEIRDEIIQSCIRDIRMAQMVAVSMLTY